MPQKVSIVTDLKTAAVLAGSAGLLGAVTVPFLLPSIFELVPAHQRTLPLPMLSLLPLVRCCLQSYTRRPRCFFLGGWTRFHPSPGSGWFPSTRSSALRVPCGIFALVLAVQSSYTLGRTWCGTYCPNCPERQTRRT